MSHPLPNPRHERFAQELAKGNPASRAYAEAGYQPHEGNASRMSANEKVAARVAELQADAARHAVVTVASITAELLDIGAKAKVLGDAPGLSVARAAHMDVAKLNGLIVDRSEVNSTVRSVISAEPLSEDEWTKKYCHSEQLPQAGVASEKLENNQN